MASTRTWRAPVVLSALICVLLAITKVDAAVGDRPLTQLAKTDAKFEFGVSVMSAATFTGTCVDVNGTMYATWTSGVMRVPPSVVDETSATSVLSYRVPFTTPADQFDPCITNPAAPVSAAYTCRQPGTEYLGDSRILYYPISGDRGSGISLPWVYNGRVYMIATDPSPRIIQYDAGSFSVYDASYNAIQNANLAGAIKVFVDSTLGFVYIASNIQAGNAVIIRIPLNDMTNQAQWSFMSFAGAAFNDVDWDPTHSTFYFIGRNGAITNGVWKAANTNANFLAANQPLSATVVSTNAATCNGTGVTIAYDADTRSGSTRGDRVYIGCTGLLNTNGYIEALNPSNFATVNSTVLLAQDDLWTKWLHDQNSGIIYIGTQGRAGSDGYANVLQYSTVDDVREGRVELPAGLSAKAMAISPLTVPEGQDRYTGPYFYVVGTNPNSQFPAIARWEGAQSCLNDCNNATHGSCSRRVCSCLTKFDSATGQTLNYLAPWCATLSCPFDCNGLGVCVNSVCQCDRVWTTANVTQPCLQPRCPNDCLVDQGRGTCDFPTTGRYNCTCSPGWSGDDCSIKVKLPCHLLNKTCSGCVDNPACIWCASARTCVYGTVNGPLDQNLKNFECRSWFWGSCPSVAIDIVNYLMTAILGICLFISLTSGVLVDTAEDVPERRTEWYLFQRAGKLWSMVYQLQLIAVAGLINFAYPTSFSGFVRYWNWILLSWGFPWHHSKQSVDAWHDSSITTGRSTQNWNQYATYWKAEPHEIFFTFLLWWGVALGVFLVFYVVMLLISLIRGGRTGFLATTRPVFILLRILEFGHLGVCVMGPLAIVKGGVASGVVGGIMWVVLGIGVPIGLFVWLGFLKEKKDLFKPTFAASCYPYYGAFDFRFRAFIVAPWVKRILIGIFIGFVSTSNPLGQLIPIAIINLVYLFFVIIQRNMFSDYLQRYLEIILAALNLVAFLFLFGFYGTPSSGVVNAMGIIFLILQFLAVTVAAAFFLISWLQLNQVYSVAQCFKFCTCRAEK